MFSLTGGGKYNFLGTKRWLEENLDHAGDFCFQCFGIVLYSYSANEAKYDHSSIADFFNLEFSSLEASLLHDNVAFVLCLDTLGNSDELYMHVSRPPKPDAPIHSFIQLLEEVANYCQLPDIISAGLPQCSRS